MSIRDALRRLEPDDELRPMLYFCVACSLFALWLSMGQPGLTTFLAWCGVP